ncbi:unnamed protein product [Triticum turgidum subsp. durum]|uniref:Uncharacterized protein n=1 Tax=Triticum turgidum subsp. durum TaxID=4567 RepID=A0A9R0W041_TRITD|nr:unnamed protein product [Triticum turgidum subsp. durum]
MVGNRRRELQERDRRRRELQDSARREELGRESREAAAAAAMAAAGKERAREKGKGKERENGGEGGKFGQQFARVFLPQLYGERLVSSS